MKAHQNILKTVLFILIAGSTFLQATYAQNSNNNAEKKESSIHNRVNEKDWVFVAQSVIPQRGGLRQLTSYYDLRVSNDSLVSNLPYSGRAYTAPIDLSQGGISFTSTSFDYTVKDRRKGGWDIAIKPRDAKDVQLLLLSVFENGTASLQVTSNNREAISFNGYIREKGQNR